MPGAQYTLDALCEAPTLVATDRDNPHGRNIHGSDFDALVPFDRGIATVITA